VENSLKHGISSLDRLGIITIKAYIEDNFLKLTVEDNGRGMDEEQIRKIFSNSDPDKTRFSGIGVGNINERIKIHFGEKYGLSFASQPGKYMVATMIIPAISENGGA